jgi:hypothetical protein
MSEEKNIEPSADDSLQTTESENISEQQTKNYKLKTMEVHHHPKVEKKNFKEYFLEFLMIFLAVTMGFFAETIREHFSDKEHEKKYIQSLYFDLKDDTANLSGNIPYWELVTKKIDTLRTELKKGDDMNKNLANIMACYVRDYGNFLYHDRTIAQLKSSGNFRIITNSSLADSIMEYDSYILSQLRDQEAHGQRLYINANNIRDKLFDSELTNINLKYGRHYVDSLLTANSSDYNIHLNNKELLFEFYNALQYWQTAIRWRLHSYIYLQKKATNMINMIKKEYHLDE